MGDGDAPFVDLRTSERELQRATRRLAVIDADQYRSIKDSIAHLWPQIVPGGAMLFDDYKCLDGATRAVTEAFGYDLPVTKNGKAYAIKG